MDHGLYSFCSSTACPPFFVYSLDCFEWKKYCQMRSADVPYFSRKERLFYCLKPLNLRCTADNLLLCAAVCSAPWPMAFYQFWVAFFLVMCHRTVNEELEVTICEVLFCLKIDSCFQSEHTDWMTPETYWQYRLGTDLPTPTVLLHP